MKNEIVSRPVYLTKTIHGNAKRIAKRNGMTLSGFVTIAIKEKIERMKNENS